MKKIEKDKIIELIDCLIENDYSKAGKHLGVLIKEKIKNKLARAKDVKPFGEKSESKDEESEDKKDEKGKFPFFKKGSSKKKSNKSK